ncbi:rRNA (adenine-N6,N6-)-dimethyltransferase [Aureococcus anophagefferens]|nr:rRNA (adenine-N6,N6-)-dimethyltransferase [Aureococcus anophagefferens]
MPKRKRDEARGGGEERGASSHLLAANKDLGQNFLKNPAIVDAIAKKLTSPKFDRRMVREVAKRVENDPRKHRLEMVHGDVLKVALPYFDVCVANLPYNIVAVPLQALAHRPHFRSAVIMFQEEFAQRLSAKPGDALYCRLSVDSRVVKIEVRNPPPPVNFVEWDGLVKLCFNRKNKTLRSTFTNKKTLADLETSWKTFRALSMTDADEAADAPDVKALVEAIMEDPRFKDKRAAKMDLDDLLALLAAFNEKGLHFSS